MGGATHTPPAPVAAVAASAPPAVPPPPMPAALRVAAAAAASAPPTTGRPLPVERDAAAATTDGAVAAKAAGEPPADAPQLDLAFCCDCTGSMGAYIRSAQDNIRRIAASIFERKGTECSMRFALVKYRDHPPQDKTFVTEVYPFTKSLEVMKANVDTMAASGGGDGPEAVTAALHEVHELNWREKATKVCVFIADAPPHGLGESGDGFPNGSPDGRDPIAVARSLAAKGITVYTIGVEPVLSTQYRFARDFFMMVASITEGKFLPLGKAEILADVIVSTAIEGMELEQMWGRFENEIRAEAQAKNEQLTEAELCARVESAMASKQAELHVAQVEVDTPYLDTRYDHSNHTALVKAANLAEARSRMSASLNSHVAHETATYAWEKQAMTSNCAAPQQMSTEQMSRASCFAKKKRGLW